MVQFAVLMSLIFCQIRFIRFTISVGTQ